MTRTDDPVRDWEQQRIVFLGVGLSLKEAGNFTREVFFDFIRNHRLCEDQFLSCFDSFEDFIQRMDDIEGKQSPPEIS